MTTALATVPVTGNISQITGTVGAFTVGFQLGWPGWVAGSGSFTPDSLVTVQPDPHTGDFIVNLEPNSLLTPANSYYTVYVYGEGYNKAVFAIVVPLGGGQLATMITASPPIPAQYVTGPAGIGVPAGGTTGQVLTKRTGTDFDTQWVTRLAAPLVFPVAAPASPITCVHSLGRHPLTVRFIDSAGNEFSVPNQDTDLNTTVLTPTPAMAGTVLIE